MINFEYLIYVIFNMLNLKYILNKNYKKVHDLTNVDFWSPKVLIKSTEGPILFPFPSWVFANGLVIFFHFFSHHQC